MNRTNFEHAGYALLMQLGIWVISGSWLAGACFGIAFFLGREHAQFQNKYGANEFASFNFTKWSLDAKLDLLFPVVAVSTVYIISKLSGL